MTKQETEEFTNLIYNDYINNAAGLTKLLQDTHVALIKMKELRGQYSIVSVEAVMETQARFEAMTKAWLMISRQNSSK